LISLTLLKGQRKPVDRFIYMIIIDCYTT